MSPLCPGCLSLWALLPWWGDVAGGCGVWGCKSAALALLLKATITAVLLEVSPRRLLGFATLSGGELLSYNSASAPLPHRWAVVWSCTLTPLPLPWQRPSCICRPHPCSSPSPTSLTRPRIPTSRCTDEGISQASLCGEQRKLSDDGCQTWELKGRHKGVLVPSWC